MILPSVERRGIGGVSKKKVWIYGAPFTGKTFFANKFPNPLMLNTDGNIKFVDAPFIPIKNEVSVEGRLTNTTLAWDIFKSAIAELEKKQNDFETIIVDLLEDTYEQCRIYMYDKLGIEHESDNSFKAWDMVRTEFLSTIKRLLNTDYNIVLISHEDMSKDFTKRTGDKVTRIAPNIQEKTANKIAGMVDIVARAVADDDDRWLTFKTTEVEFGGGRLTLISKKIPLEYEDFLKVYEEGGLSPAATTTTEEKPKRGRKPKEEPIHEEPSTNTAAEEQQDNQTVAPEPAKRGRRSKKTEEPSITPTDKDTPPADDDNSDSGDVPPWEQAAPDPMQDAIDQSNRMKARLAREMEKEAAAAAESSTEEKPKRTRRSRHEQ